MKTCRKGQIFDFAIQNFLNGKRSDMDTRPIGFCSATDEDPDYIFIMKFGENMSRK
jgi:hypothetical protein